MKKMLYIVAVVATLFVSGCSNVQNAKLSGVQDNSLQIAGGSYLYRNGCIANMFVIGFGCYSYTVDA